MWLWVLAGAALLLCSAVTFRLARVARRRDRAISAMEDQQRVVAERNAFEATVHRALEMAIDERGAFATMREALARAVGPEHSVLVHLAEGAETDDALPGSPAATVALSPLPSQCVASQRGQTFVFPSSEALDACPLLKADPAGPSSAVCVPLSIAGLGAGAIRVRGRVDHPPDDEVIARVQLVARKIGERVAMLRAFAHTESLAATDPLTELPNRRSFEARAELSLPKLSGYSVLFGDLDRFKLVNDVHGHDAGDRALRIFAGALSAALRPDDLACRYGGEEFVVLLPECDRDEAVRVAERIRATLAAALDGSELPAFTVSFGVASSRRDATFDEIVELADRALLAAKAAGRDRVVAAGDLARVVAVPEQPDDDLAAEGAGAG
jgi:diguanylate cyclase (GGDEF)-like protein